MSTALARFVGLVAAVALVVLSQTGAAQESGQPGVVLTPIEGQVATVAELMAQADGLAADGGGWQGAYDVAAPSSFAAMTLAETGAIPSDASLGVGPTQVLVIANGRLRSFNKNNGAADGVLDLNPSTFFGSVHAGSGVFGGRVKFDRWTGRWFVTMATDSTPGRIVLASSNSATLTSATTWRFSAFDNTFSVPSASACAVDMPTLALDSVALYLGVNQFCGGVYAGTSGFVVRKSSAIDTATLVVTVFHNLTNTAIGTGPYAPRGVDNVDVPATVGYFVGVDNAAFGQLVIRRVVNPGGTPTLADQATLAVPQTQLPILVPHAGNTAGTNGQINPGDDRLASAVMRNGRLWLVHTVGTPTTVPPATNGTRWYEVATPESSPTLAQSGTLEDAGGAGARHYWNGSLAVTGEGRTVVGFNVAGTSELISAGLADRRAATPAGTLSSATLVAAIPAAYNPTLDPGSATGRRWGRYSETVTDGCDDMTVWSVQSVAEPANSWTLRVARIVSTPPPSATAVFPASVEAGKTSVTVDITTTSGRFFDSAAGFGCRIAVTIPGVAVTQVTRLTATTLRVTLSTANVTAGVKTITVTHPDGQTSSSAGLLSVTPAVDGLAPPFGFVDTPADGATVAGEVGFTGWAIGAAGVRDVRVYRDSVGAEPAGLVYVGTADFLRGARPDVQAAHPGYPDNDRAGWGFMVLTNMLPNRGNGQYVFTAVATDNAGRSTIIGTRRITGANAVSQLPFGTIDTPGQGAEVSGTVVNFGWVLTPSPLGIPTDGSSIYVYIDGVMVGHPVYNQYRSDIATLFPGYANSNGAVGYFIIDTTKLADGLHSIVWGVSDSAGQVNGIGSRNFRVKNGS